MTPNASYKSDADLTSTLPESTRQFSEPWMPDGSNFTSSPRFDEFKQEDFFSAPAPFPDPQVHVFATDRFSAPAFEESKTSFPSSADDDFFPPPVTSSRYAPSSSSARVSQSGMFSRTHPTSQDYIRQRKHSTAANVQSFRTGSFVAPQDNFLRPSSDYAASEQPAVKGSHPSGRLASVVGKHAALMARLKVLKAARIRRTTDSSPYGHEQLGSSAIDNSGSSRPKSSIGRAIASVYKSRRSNSSTNYVEAKYGSAMAASAASAYTPRSEPPTRRPTSLAQSLQQEHFKFDPFNPAFPKDEMNDDCFSESTWESSTHFGGKAFVAALEVE